MVPQFVEEHGGRGAYADYFDDRHKKVFEASVAFAGEIGRGFDRMRESMDALREEVEKAGLK